jgi:hypothetical protein
LLRDDIERNSFGDANASCDRASLTCPYRDSTEP